MEIVPQFAGSDWLYMALSAEALGAGSVNMAPSTLSNWADLFANVWVLPDAMRGKTVETLASRALEVYKKNEKFDKIVIGPPSGSISHISALLGAPYLASEFWVLDVSPIASDAHDSMGPFIERCMEIRNNFFIEDSFSDVVLHYDPVHNRSLDLLFANMEVKMSRLPDAYVSFIDNHLKKDGALVLNNCQYRWPHYKVDERTHIQIGGYGGISPLEYQTGSDRIDAWLEAQGSSHRGGWTLDYPMTDGSETEWGITSSFITSLVKHCAEKNIALYSINSEHPYDLSEPLLSLYPGKKLFVDAYWNTSPKFSLKTHNPPLWSVYSDEQSLSLCEKTISKFDYPEYFLSLYPAEGPDIPGVDDWVDIFPANPTLLGAKKLPFSQKLPALSSITSYRNRLRRFKKREPLKINHDDIIDAFNMKLLVA